MRIILNYFGELVSCTRIHLLIFSVLFYSRSLNLFILTNIGIIRIIIYIFKGQLLITQDQLTMVAIPSMNDMHLEEMLLINALHEAVKSRDFKSIKDKLEELLKESKIHFSKEEEMMEEAGYPEFFTHKGEHDRQLHELAHIIKYFTERQDPQAIAAYIEGNLNSWTIHHMQTMDAEMATFLQSNSTNA